MNTIQSLKELYVKLGGSLTDTYSGIAGGIPVSDYTVIPDMIKALYAIYDGDLTEVYPEISDVAVSDYSTTPKAIEALAEVATKGIAVNESYDISEGTLQKIIPTITGDYILTIPNGITTINNRVLKDEQGNNTITPHIITKLIMPNTVTEILGGPSWEGGGAFEGCYRLNEIVFSNLLETIGGYCFASCTSLTSITIPDSVTSIGGSAFDNCTALTSITIGNSVTSIGDNAFSGCSGLTSITIPDSVTSIGEYAFQYCASLTSITIPDSVTSIGVNAFNGCTALTDIYYTGTQAEWEAITGISGAGIPTGATIHYEYTPE